VECRTRVNAQKPSWVFGAWRGLVKVVVEGLFSGDWFLGGRLLPGSRVVCDYTQAQILHEAHNISKLPMLAFERTYDFQSLQFHLRLSNTVMLMAGLIKVYFHDAYVEMDILSLGTKTYLRQDSKKYSKRYTNALLISETAIPYCHGRG
jgi:hypothetical protein